MQCECRHESRALAMRPCIPRDAPHAPPMEKQGLDLSTGSGFSGLSGHQLSGLHAVSSLAQLAPLGGPLPLGAGSPFGSRAVDPAAATLNLSLNLPLSQSPHQLREILLAQLIRGESGDCWDAVANGDSLKANFPRKGEALGRS